MKQHIIHPIPPFFDAESNILILGSFPSVKSREQMFFYGHPQNRYWKVIAAVFDDTVPVTIPGSCDIEGSSDSSIKNVSANDLAQILYNSKVERIFVNGKTAEKYYKKFTESVIGIKATCLPSTSPANATCSLEQLIGIWKEKING